MSLILEFKDVCFFYGDRQILNKFNCQVKEAELVSVIGSSGCGKTTFLRLCAGLEKPLSGDIYLRQELVASPKKWVPASQRSIGYVFQNFALFEKTTVEKNIYYGCKTGEHRAEALRLIELMGLSEHLNKKPYQLSGGERQRVALARSLALKPDLMLLDEPFSSIDQAQTQFLIGEIKKLFKELGVSALMVTHSKDEAVLFSDRCLEFY